MGRGNGGANKGKSWKCKPKQRTIQNLVQCTKCTRHYTGFRTKGIKYCPDCKAEKDKIAKANSLERVRRYRENKLLRTRWDDVVGNKNLIKRWILIYGKESLVCATCGSTEWENIELHHKIFFNNTVHSTHDPSNLTPLCSRCHFVFHYENGKDGKY